MHVFALYKFICFTSFNLLCCLDFSLNKFKIITNGADRYFNPLKEKQILYYIIILKQLLISIDFKLFKFQISFIIKEKEKEKIAG